jgi:hypothetical protein
VSIVTGSSVLEPRLVVFLDLLGFADAMDALQVNPGLAAGIRDALEGLTTTRSILAGNPIRPEGLEMTSFSDTIVISVPLGSFEPAEQLDLSWPFLYLALSELHYHLLSQDLMLRGAIAQGSLYHRGEIVFGPALVEAYRRERDLAVYPRIVVPDDVAQSIEALCEQDQDGVWFLNVLGCNWPSSEVLTNVGSAIDRMSIRERDGRARAKVLAKLTWLHSYYQRIVKRVARSERLVAAAGGRATRADMQTLLKPRGTPSPGKAGTTT